MGSGAIDCGFLQDTVLVSEYPTTNTNGAHIYVGLNYPSYGYYMLMRPDFTNWTNGKPASPTITSIELRLTHSYTENVNAQTTNFHRVLKAWEETQATYRIYKTNNAWAGGSGGMQANTDYVGTAHSSGSIAGGSISVGTLKTFTLNATEIMKLYDGTYTNNGFVMFGPGTRPTARSFASRTHGTASYRPVMRISYTYPDSNKFFMFF